MSALGDCVIWLLILEAFACAAFFVCTYLGVHGLHFEHKVNLPDIFSVLVNLSIAFVIQHYLARRGVALKTEKDFLLRELDELTAHVSDARSNFVKAIGVPLSQSLGDSILAALVAGEEALTTLNMGAEFSHCKKLVPDIKVLINSYILYKDQLTGGNFPNITYSGFQQSQADSCKRELFINVQKLRAKIIRA